MFTLNVCTLESPLDNFIMQVNLIIIFLVTGCLNFEIMIEKYKDSYNILDKTKISFSIMLRT